MITKTIGKNTLGDNNKMQVSLRTYNRSTHNLSYVWRNTQAVGTLIPFMSIPMMKDDTFKIKLQPNVMTHPTIGPLFGSFKMQNDIFFCPIRLYNSWLHNNKLKIGLNMQQVKLPRIDLSLEYQASGEKNWFNQLANSSILTYLGVRALGRRSGSLAGEARRSFNAVPLLAYYDIFKNYYANKQEDNFITVDNSNEITSLDITPKSGETITIQTPSRITGLGNPINYIKTMTVHGVNWETFKDGVTTYVKDNQNITVKNSEIWTNVNITSENTFTVKPTTTEINSIPTAIKAGIGKMVSHKLEDLDNIREEILATAGDTPYIINGNNNINFLNYLMTKKTAKTPVNQKVGFTFREEEWGIVTKTYQSDMCQNWINTEWLDGDDGINKITAVAVENGSFTIDALNLANKVYNMLNRIAVSDGSYRSWLETVYTGGYTERTETPIYCGGSSAEVVFQEVISNSATAEEPLGTLAGRGLDTNHKGGSVIVRATEPGYLIGITSLTPRLDYTQGNQWDVNLKSIDDLHKPALDGIGFQDLDAELLDARATSYGDNGIEHQFIGKQPAWLNYMTNINKAFGNFCSNENFMILSRQYEVNDSTGKFENLTTYIDPSLFNNIFADQSFNAQNFWVQIGVQIEARRLMSAKIIPNL